MCNVNTVRNLYYGKKYRKCIKELDSITEENMEWWWFYYKGLILKAWGMDYVAIVYLYKALLYATLKYETVMTTSNMSVCFKNIKQYKIAQELKNDSIRMFSELELENNIIELLEQFGKAS